MSDWDEGWLGITRLSDLQPLMSARFDALASKGCDGVDPDNVDCFANEQD